MTITVGGTVVVTIAGTPFGAKLTFVAGPIPGPYIPTAGSAVTHNADQIIWTLPSAMGSVSGELSAVWSPYLRNGVGTSTQRSIARDSIDASYQKISMIIKNTAIYQFTRGSVGSSNGFSWDQPSVNNGVTSVRSLAWDGTNVVGYNNAAQVNFTAKVNPYATVSALAIGNGNSGLESLDGALSVIYTPGGKTAAERAAESRLFANRQITWAV
jgi:hypothetical protein